MTKINIGIIGCGRIADLHYLGYKDNANAKIIAVCDSDASIAQARKEEWGAARYYTDFRQMLTDAQVDAVEILTPHNCHETMVVEAAAAGKHIAVQKPMANTLASADRMIAAARQAGIVYKVTDNYLFYPPIVTAKKMIAAGDIGEPVALRIKYIGGGSGGWNVPPSSWEWRMRESAAGRGMITFDHGHHLWAAAWYLLGSIERVNAWIDSCDGIVDCPAIVSWKYNCGAVYGVCDLAFAADLKIPSKYYANDEWLEITGSRGIIFVRRCTGDIHSGPVLNVFSAGAMKEIAIASDWQTGFSGATHNFIAAITGQAQPRLSGEEAREVLRFSLAIQKSARLRREVYPQELDSRFPAIYARIRKRREMKAAKTKGGWLFAREKFEKYAPHAAELTQKLLERFDPEAVKSWETTIVLYLEAHGNTPAQSFTLRIKDGVASLGSYDSADSPQLTLRVSAGLWAALLLGKKKITTAVITGKLKIEGRAEEAMRLRRAFRL